MKINASTVAFLIGWCMVAITVSPSGASAQSLLEAVQAARSNDPRLRAAQAEFMAVQTSIDRAKAGFRPTARVDVDRLETRQRTLSSESSLTTGSSSIQFPTRTGTLVISQPVFRKDAIERMAQAKAGVQQAEYTLLAAEHDLLLRTTAAYLVLMAATDNLELARAEREAVSKALDLARERLSTGLGTIINQVDAQARLAITQAREIESRNKLLDAQQALREITGMQFARVGTLREDFEPQLPNPGSVESWLETAMSLNKGLNARRESVEVARQEVEVQKAGHYPGLSLLLQSSFRDGGNGIFGGGSRVASTELSLRLSVPLYEGGLTSALIEEAVHRLSRASAELEAEQRSVERGVRVYHDGVVVGVRLISAYRQSIEAQSRALEAKELSHKSGLITLLPVLDAQRDLLLAKKDYEQSRYEFLLNRVRLQQASGTLSETDLQEIYRAMK